MKNLIDKILEHPRAQNETYLTHMKCALKCALMLFAASVACFIHSFIPFIFKKTATKLASCVINARCKSEEV
tara:strand:- start:1177 stop:1392 length:216 start_codon:yes stop_codon:yes gene_type:complete